MFSRQPTDWNIIACPVEPSNFVSLFCFSITRYSVFTINVPLAVRFATVAIGMRKAESPEYGRFDRDLH